MRRRPNVIGGSGVAQARLRIATSWMKRMRGLLFSPMHSEVLLLAPCSDVHTVGMRYDLDIAFVDADGTVVEAYRDVGPMKRIRCRGAVATIERFSEQGPWFGRGDRIGIGVMPERRNFGGRKA